MSRPSAPIEQQRRPPSTVIIGAGDLGMRLARVRAGLGDRVLAVRRRPLAEPGIDSVAADVATGDGLGQLPAQARALVFCAAPDRRDEPAYRRLFVDGLARVLLQVSAERVVLVSSSAVYGEDAGEPVDEGTPARPSAFNGRVLLEAERQLQGRPGGVVLRLAGLYGPGRGALLRRARQATSARRHWTNRIHVDDAAAALSCLVDLPAPGPLYLGSDGCPALEADVFGWLRDLEGLPVIPVEPGHASGRRIINARLRSTGWTPRFTDYRAGYAALLEETGAG